MEYPPVTLIIGMKGKPSAFFNDVGEMLRG